MTNPIKLKDMALTTDQWLLIHAHTVNDGTVEVNSLHRHKNDIHGDMLHSKKTMERILESRAIDLTCRLLRAGVKITFKDEGISESIIAQVSPPLYDKCYKTKTV